MTRIVELENKKLHDLIVEKDALVKAGRKISSELETVEFKINKCEDKERAITAKIEVADLVTKGEILWKEIERKMKEYDALVSEIRKQKLAGIPEQLAKDHHAYMEKRKELETERNKIALKVQKYKDKLVPLLKKNIKPHLGEYDDTETVEVKNGKIIVKIFNHVEDFKSKFKSRS